MKILICEDNPLAMKTLSVVLKRDGFEVTTAADGNEAIKYMESETYDVFLFDIHLPYHSGLELLQYARTTLNLKTPSIILSAFSDPRIQSQAWELGINGYMTKPFSPSDLVDKIRTVINQSVGNAEAC